MSSSEDFSDSESEFVTKKSQILEALVSYDIEEFKQLVDSPKWWKVADRNGDLLLHKTILHDNEEAFNHLISIEDYPLDAENDQGETALKIALSRYFYSDSRDFEYDGDYYGPKLIEKGANVDNYADYLKLAIEGGYVGVMKLLIEKGADINEQYIYSGSTPLHLCCDEYRGLRKPSVVLLEGITMLLYYNADPSIIDNNGFTPFDVIMKNKKTSCDSLLAQELLFYYTFDEYTTEHEILVEGLLVAAGYESPLFYLMIDNIVAENFYCFPEKAVHLLFQMKSEYLKVLIEKCENVVEEILLLYRRNRAISSYFNSNSPENLCVLLDSKLQSQTVDFIYSVYYDSFIRYMIESNCNESTITKFICTLLSYGINIEETHLQRVYRTFGYCELFKILLHMDLKRGKRIPEIKDVMPRLIYDVTFDIEHIIENPILFEYDGLEDVLDFSAHPKIKDFLSNSDKICITNKLKILPEIPLLVELARNAFRKYFIRKFHITKAKQFYTLLNGLPISVHHSKIIAFETKLY